MLKKMTSLLCAIVFLVTMQYSVVQGGQVSAQVFVDTEKISDSVYAVRLSVINASDLYGLSLDMQFDDTKLEVVKNAAGEALGANPPVVPSVDYLGVGTHIGLNQLKTNKISFMAYLTGNKPGISVTSNKLAATIYFKVKSGQTFSGFESFSLTDIAKNINNSTLCVKLSDSNGGKIPVSIAGLPQDIAATIIDDLDGYYFSGGTFKVSFMSDLLEANQYKLILMKKDQTNVIIPNAAFVKDAATQIVTVTATNLPSITEGAVFGVIMQVNASTTAVAKFKVASIPLYYYPAYNNALVTFTPALSSIANLNNTSVPLKISFGTKGSIEVPAGLNIQPELDKYYHLQDYVQFHVNDNNDGLFFVEVNKTELGVLTARPATISINGMTLDAVKVTSSTQGETAIDVQLDTANDKLSFAITSLQSRWTIAKGEAVLNLNLAVNELVGKNVQLANQSGQLIIQRAGVTIKTVDFQGTSRVAGYTSSVTVSADLKQGDTCYVKMAGYKSSTYTFAQDTKTDDQVGIGIDLKMGNLNTDNKVDAADLAIFAQNYGQTGNGNKADINHDGLVNVKDLFYITKNLE